MTGQLKGSYSSLVPRHTDHDDQKTIRTRGGPDTDVKISQNVFHLPARVISTHLNLLPLIETIHKDKLEIIGPGASRFRPFLTPSLAFLAQGPTQIPGLRSLALGF